MIADRNTRFTTMREDRSIQYEACKRDSALGRLIGTVELIPAQKQRRIAGSYATTILAVHGTQCYRGISLHALYSL
jgi:hypothetical protein